MQLLRQVWWLVLKKCSGVTDTLNQGRIGDLLVITIIIYLSPPFELRYM